MYEWIFLFAALAVSSAIAYAIASYIQITVGKYVESSFWRRNDE
jgi:hypothetical protein